MTAKYEKLAAILREMISKNENTGSFQLPTEQELCRKYGVSRQTVRHALSVLEEEHLIERRQGSGSYATGLRADAGQNQVAILISTDTEYIYPALLTSLKSAFSKEGYQTTVYLTHNSVSTERTILKEILTKQFRGILVEGVKTAFPNPNLDLYERLQGRGTALMFLHGYYPELSAPYVMDDNVTGGYSLGKYLIGQGHEKIAAIFCRDDIQGPRRYLGLQMAMRDLNSLIPDVHTAWFDTEDIISLRTRQDTGFLLDFIRKQKQYCTAIVCYNDEIAYWLIKELNYSGIQVPEDIKVVSFDNTYLSTLSTVSITSLTHDAHEMSRAAAENLIRSMHGLPVSAKKIPWHLVAKGSFHI